MGCFQHSCFYLLLFLIAASTECKAETQKTCSKKSSLSITHAQGEYMSVSCLSTTQHLNQLRLKFNRINPDKEILKYPDSSPAAEHQRWSVRMNAGNVTLYLNEVNFTDAGQYECEVYRDWDCLTVTTINLKVKECKILDSIHAIQNSSVILPCSGGSVQPGAAQITWETIHGDQSADIYPTCKRPNRTEESMKPLCERVRIMNGSLRINPVEYTDDLWYRCRVNKRTCSEVKLQVKDYKTFHSSVISETLSMTSYATVMSDVLPSPSTGEKTPEASNVTVMMVSIMSACVLMSLMACVIVYFKKRRAKKPRVQTTAEFDNRYSVYYSQVSREMDVPLYSLVEYNRESMTTFGAKQTEGAA